MAETLRDQPPQAADRQRKYRHETTNGRMERRLPDASPCYQNYLVRVCPAGLTESVFTNAEYKSGKYDIPWLTWLLSAGSRVVVLDHSINYDHSPRSRSGKALMVEDGGVFRVDPKYAGSPGDNVISRMICSEVKEIQNIMVSEIKKQF
jgi:hypothetical protein